jgi:hypothetical protein
MMCNNPGGGEFVRETGIGMWEGGRVGIKWRVAESKRAHPVSKRDRCHVPKEGKMVIEVLKEAHHSSAVIELGDGGELETVKVKRHGEKRRVK